MVEGSKQVRVDNWGIFFLQRLQIFFSKTDYCDLTLQFEGNVQLKVHRLVMNACTEYFTYLEQTCPALEEGTIMMPPDLQSDVIVPIVNFMYTGMLEFHMSIFEKLYKAAEIMNISVLIKLLDAQKRPHPVKGTKRKLEEVTSSQLTVKTVPKGPSTSDLPSTLPGRKQPVWKRKTIPHHSSHSDYHDKWSADPLTLPDTRPKPTRFEWPDDDLPPLALMDTAFEEISYTSKPLLTQEEENRGIPNTASTSSCVMNSSEDPKHTSPNHSKRNVGKSIIENSKVEKTRTKSESSGFEEVILFGGEEYEIAQKRKIDANASKSLSKKSKNGDKENKETTISIKANSNDLDHTKIVSEILKKYPNLVKKNKNIKLKIMPVTTPNKKTVPEKPIPGFHEIKRKIVKPDSSSTVVKHKIQTRSKKIKDKTNLDGPWVCDKCDGHVEFVLYYLYRKHMTDVHNEVFDIRLCKYCGQKCSKPNLMMYHLYTKHELRPPTTYVFPKCDQCPYIALSDSKLILHKQRHQPTEMQCVDCKLAFSNQNTLTTHIQITGHFNRTLRSTFDCQYCTKKLSSTINLFSHIKNAHLKEAKRDGIVALDELDETDEDDNTDSEEEYIVPDLLTGTNIPKDKVKIISNVKVPNRGDQTTPQNAQALVPLVQTTEADSLNSVSSNIATSLGLVDIVVLDENQQYILQENQEQTEFILPELSTGDNHFGAQVITTQHSNVIPQGVLQASGNDITSTDELVMVLTDHDYQEEQEGENTDNSNIVVLYSHPVDGQQGQFITSQGNLLVNSQTGMLELRNGTTITTTTSNQIVVNSNNVDTPIESIEMIQREIESHQDLKGELYEEEKHATVNQSQSKIDNESMTLEEITSNDVIINDFTECEAEEVEASVSSENKIQKDESEAQQTAEQNPEMYLAEGDDQNTSEVNTETQTSNISNQPVENIECEQPNNMETADDTAENVEKASAKEAPIAKESVVDGNVQDIIDGTQEEPMEIEEIHSTDVVTENKSPEAMEIQETEEICQTKQECDGEPSDMEEKSTSEAVDVPPASNDVPPAGTDIPPESVDIPPESGDIPPEGVNVINENVDVESVDVAPEGADIPTEGADVPHETRQSEVQPEFSEESVEQPETSSLLCNEVSERLEETNNEEMEVDGVVADNTDDEPNEDLPLSSQEAETENCPKSPELAIEDDHELIVTEDPEPQESSEATVAKQGDDDDDEEDSPFIEKDESSKSTTESQNTRKSNPNINREILQDWEEDTDSQQSEKQNSSKSNNRSEEIESDSRKDEQRQAAVDKLMNDWEDDEEDEKRD